MTQKTKYNFFIITILITLFVVFNGLIYTSNENDNPIHNCWSCHQTYGLGGYLGPDLTNVYSAENKGPLYIKAFLNSGVKAMPKFNFSEAEKEALVTYLKFIDSTGYYPNYNAKFKPNGWVELEYKNEK